MIDSSNFRKYLIGVLALALVARLAVMLVLHTWTFPTEREFGFEAGEIGYALANGQGFSWPQTWRPVGPPGAQAQHDQPVPTAWEAPIYPLIIGMAFKALGSYTAQAAVALELFQISLSLLTCFMLFHLGKLLFNEWAGLLACFMAALYPAGIYFAVQKVGYVTLLVLVALLLIHQAIQLAARPSLARSLALGGLCGVASLVSPVIVAFYPFALLWFVWRCQSPWPGRFKCAAAIMLCCAATMTPWLIRNYLVFHRFVFLKPNFTRELVRGNFGEETRPVASGKPTDIPADEGRMSASYNEKAINLVLKNPGRFLRQTATRSKDFWFRMETPNPRSKLVGMAAYYPVLLLGLFGMWTARRDRHAQLLIVFVLAMPLPYYMTWAVMARYRFPVEPFLILFAAGTLASWIFRNSHRTSALSTGEKTSLASKLTS